MTWRILILAALLGAVLQACGDSSATDPTGGSSGNDDVGVSDGDSGHSSDCPKGQFEKKADDGKTVCITQPSVEGDGAIGDAEGAGGSIDPPDAGSDAEPIPDAAADPCPALDGQTCHSPEGWDCIFQQTEESNCSFDCMSQGSPAFRSLNLEQVLSAVEYCGMEL